MDRKVSLVVLLIALSVASTAYSIFLVFTFHSTVVYGHLTFSQASEAVVRQPSFLIPISMGIIGWLTTVYEVLTIGQREFPKTLRKKMLRVGFDNNIYKMFSGRGGDRRIAIMGALDTPKLRNEIANITNTDWKEVDRNVKILVSVNLVKIEYSHGSLSVYRLTESGRELLDIIQSQNHNRTSKASIMRS